MLNVELGKILFFPSVQRKMKIKHAKSHLIDVSQRNTEHSYLRAETRITLNLAAKEISSKIYLKRTSSISMY